MGHDMAQKSVKNTVTHDENDDTTGHIENVQTFSRETEDFLQSIGDPEALIKVYRKKMGAAQGMELLFSCQPGQFTREELEEHLQTTYGGGDYVVRVYVGKPRQLHAVEPLSVAAPIKLAGLAPANVADNRDDFLRMMMAQQQESRDTMMAMMQNSTQMMMGVVQAIAGRPQQQNNLADTIQLAQLLTGKQQSTSPTEILQLIMQGIELGKETAGNGGGDESIFQTMVKSFGPLAATLAAQGNGNGALGASGHRPATPAMRPQVVEGGARPLPLQKSVTAPQPLQVSEDVPAGRIAPRVDTTPAPSDDVQSAQDEYFAILKRCINASKRGSDPALWAEILVDEIPPGDLDGLIHIAESDDLFTHFIVVLENRFGKLDDVQLEWFTTLRAELRSMSAMSATDLPEIDAMTTDGA